MNTESRSITCDNCGRTETETSNPDGRGWYNPDSLKPDNWFYLSWMGAGKWIHKDLCSYTCLVQFCSRDITGPVEKAEEDINLQNNADAELKRVSEAVYGS